jgi:hypothetical protein
MIRLTTNNGHDQKIIDAFNKVSHQFSDPYLLSHILTHWADDSDIEGITTFLNNLLSENDDDDTKNCSITGEPMTEGWVANDGEIYFKYEKDALAWCLENEYESIEDAYENEAIYYTEWE